MDFWHPPTITELVQSRPSAPVSDIASLVAGFWPVDESADDFINYIYRQRHEDALRY
jgi:hypothetical protein